MEYTAPVLSVIGTAQALVLGEPLTNGIHDNGCDPGQSSACLEVLGLDD